MRQCAAARVASRALTAIAVVTIASCSATGGDGINQSKVSDDKECWAWPVGIEGVGGPPGEKKYPITSGWNLLRFINGRPSPHRAIDIGTPVGTPVRCGISGKLTLENKGSCGQSAIIDGEKLSFVHCHLRVLTEADKRNYPELAKLRHGAQVSATDICGLTDGRRGAPGAGSSGAPHLHLSIHRRDRIAGFRATKPVEFFKANLGKEVTANGRLCGASEVERPVDNNAIEIDWYERRQTGDGLKCEIAAFTTNTKVKQIAIVGSREKSSKKEVVFLKPVDNGTLRSFSTDSLLTCSGREGVNLEALGFESEETSKNYEALSQRAVARGKAFLGTFLEYATDGQYDNDFQRSMKLVRPYARQVLPTTRDGKGVAAGEAFLPRLEIGLSGPAADNSCNGDHGTDCIDAFMVRAKPASSRVPWEEATRLSADGNKQTPPSNQYCYTPTWNNARAFSPAPYCHENRNRRSIVTPLGANGGSGNTTKSVYLRYTFNEKVPMTFQIVALERDERQQEIWDTQVPRTIWFQFAK